jgi:hypothetical protein
MNGEISLTGLISVAVTMFFGFVALVAWLIRLESKANSTAETVEWLSGEHEKLKTVVDGHRTDNDIHFNVRIDKQVEEKHKQRFEMLESHMKDMATTFEKRFDVLNTKLDKVLAKE